MVANGSIWSRNKHIYSLVSLSDTRLVNLGPFPNIEAGFPFGAFKAFKANLVLGAVTHCTDLKKVLVATTDPSLLSHLNSDVLLICGLIYPIWVCRGIIDSKCKAELKLFTPMLQFLLRQKSYFFSPSQPLHWLSLQQFECHLFPSHSLVNIWHVSMPLVSNRLSSRQILNLPLSPETTWWRKPLGNQGLISHAFNS